MSTPPPLSEPLPLHARLAAAHDRLLRIHKELIDHERRRYERTHGRVNSPGELFQLLISDPFFDWLRSLSQLIVAIDEYVSSKDPVEPAAGEALLAQAHELLTPSDTGTPFQREYQRALQESPDVAMIHAANKLSPR